MSININKSKKAHLKVVDQQTNEVYFEGSKCASSLLIRGGILECITVEPAVAKILAKAKRVCTQTLRQPLRGPDQWKEQILKNDRRS